MVLALQETGSPIFLTLFYRIQDVSKPEQVFPQSEGLRNHVLLVCLSWSRGLQKDFPQLPSGYF